MLVLWLRRLVGVVRRGRTVVLFFVVAVVTLLKTHEPSAASRSLDGRYERQILADESLVVPGLGARGEAAELLGEAAELLGERSLRTHAINVYLSDRIALNRSLADNSPAACSKILYDAELPTVSVVIPFYNEPYSVLLRAAWSVLASVRRDQPWFQRARLVKNGQAMKLGYPGQSPRSRHLYLRELILVDDGSTREELRGKLAYYVRTRMPGIVKLLRLPRRKGIVGARMAGALAARGRTLVMLDAQCEVGGDWLRPLVQHVARGARVALPVVHAISASTFEHLTDTGFQVGGFLFQGTFTWIDVPPWEKRRRNSDIAPARSPTMVGGVFAISRSWFLKVGGYDEGMTGWGGENLEMSFRIWQCGGSMETLPCSRVGHVMRDFPPYNISAFGSDTLAINMARAAEVWMDDYADVYYMYHPKLRNSRLVGDVTSRRALRQTLKCRGFEWYLARVYREKFVPVRDSSAHGRFRNPLTGLCLDTGSQDSEGAPLTVSPCRRRSWRQLLFLSLHLRTETRCAALQSNYTAEESTPSPLVTRQVSLYCCECWDKRRGHSLQPQQWRYLPTKQLQHVRSGLCLDAGLAPGGVQARACRRAAPAQVWEIESMQDHRNLSGLERSLRSLNKRFKRLRFRHT